MIIELTKEQARKLVNERKGLFGHSAENQKKYGAAYIGEANGNTYIEING